MKKLWKKVRRPFCGVIMFICLFLLLGCTGTSELEGGDMNTYFMQGIVLLTAAFMAGAVGGFMK